MIVGYLRKLPVPLAPPLAVDVSLHPLFVAARSASFDHLVVRLVVFLLDQLLRGCWSRCPVRSPFVTRLTVYFHDCALVLLSWILLMLIDLLRTSQLYPDSLDSLISSTSYSFSTSSLSNVGFLVFVKRDI